MKDGLFSRAQKYITPALVREYCYKQATESGDQLTCCSPLREDKNPSFSINMNSGLWKDYGTDDKGNFFKLMARIDQITEAQAAEKILRAAGAWEERKKKKPDANPGDISAKAWAELNAEIVKKWIVEKYGGYTGGWKYRNKDGVHEYAQARFIKDGKKTDIPFYYGVDKKWHQGLPPYYKTRKLPLYNRELFTPVIKKVILVEGCKCAGAGQQEIGSEKQGIVVMSWGGCSQVDIRRWKFLQERQDIPVIIWPDKDMKVGKTPYQQPGMKAAIKIQRDYLPWAEILDPYQFDDHNEFKDGWDIADCVEAGHDARKFIKECPRYVPGEEQEDPEPGSQKFLFLGFTAESYYFLPGGAPHPFPISRRNVNKQALLNLETNLDWWSYQFPASGQAMVCWDAAVSWINTEGQAAGWYDPARVRGSGFWREGEDIYCNTGKNIMTPEGAKIKPIDIQGESIYVKSQLQLKTITDGPAATEKKGEMLRLLFEAQGFNSTLEAWELLGWSLMAPFGSLLTWRPCAWLTGPTGTGKSFILENLIMPLACEFAFIGSGKTTPASIKRAVGNNSRVVILDEMELRNGKDHYQRSRIRNIVEMARNAASNSSNVITQVGAGGVVKQYVIFSPFLFASVLPNLQGEAIKNRFFTPCLDGKITVTMKKEGTSKLLATGILQDPGIFIRRNFQQIKQILANIEYLQGELCNVLGDQRKADNYAPVFSFIFALENTGEITSEFINLIYDMLAEITTREIISDEDALIQEILQIIIKLDDNRSRTVGRLISKLLKWGDNGDENESLSLLGIYYNKNKNRLAISYNNSQLRKALQNTTFAAGYGDVLKRHPLALSPDLIQVKIAGANCRCVIFTQDNFLKILGPEVKCQEAESDEFKQGEL